jgi:hypothetical protein
MMLRLAVCALGLLAVPVAASAQVGSPPTLTVGHAADGERPVIDGAVDDSVWNKVPPFTTFIQQEPNEGQPATERTEIRFLQDRQHLYVSVICFDSNRQNILVSQSRRDANLGDTDSISILLDTFNDGQNAFVFGTNPFGIEFDGQVMAEGQTGQGGGGGGGVGFNVNWDADWVVRAQQTERGWEAEFAIPLKTLRYNPGEDRTWGVNVLRNIRHKNEQVFLSPVPRGYNLHRVSVAGKLLGLSLPARRDIKLLPYIAGSVTDEKTLRTETVRREGDVGLDFKWGVRSDLTLDLTVNTDFAQVEADEQQVNLTRFPLFFAEKRPFFLENAQLFQLGQPQSIDLFFSRRIGLLATGEPVDIVGGGRLSGKLGGYNVGLLNMQTDAAVDRRTGATLAPANNFSVLRLQREVGRSNVGAMFVGRAATGARAGIEDERALFRLSGALRLAGGQGRVRLCRPRVLHLYASVVDGERRLFSGRRRLQSRSRLSAAPRVSPGRSAVQPQLPAEAVALDSSHPAARQHQRVHQLAERARKLSRPLALLRHPDAYWRAVRISNRDPAGSPVTAVHGLPGCHRPSRHDSCWPVRMDSRRVRGPHQLECSNLGVAAASHRQLLRRRLPRVESDPGIARWCEASD